MLIAVDTNVLMDFAVDDGDVMDAVQTIRARLKTARFVVTPTVIQELANLYERGADEARGAAERALRDMLGWGFEPMNLIPAGHGIVEQISLRLRILNILPEEEVGDGLIIAEAALMGCQMLLTADHHMLDAQEHPRFRKALEESDVEGSLVIARPRYIVKHFFRQK